MKTLGRDYFIFPFHFTYKGWRVTGCKIPHFGVRNAKIRLLFEIPVERLIAERVLCELVPGPITEEKWGESYRRYRAWAQDFLKRETCMVRKTILVPARGRAADGLYKNPWRQWIDQFLLSSGSRFSMARRGQSAAVRYIDDCLGDVRDRWFAYDKSD